MTVRRTDPFSSIHKALRKLLYELSVLVGRTDLGDVAAVTAFEPALARTVDLLNAHATFEEGYLFPLVRKAGITDSQHFEEEHRHHDQELKALLEQARALRQGGNAQGAGGRDFYRALNRFIASYLLHLDEEETKLAPRIYEKVPNADVASELQRFRATRTPEQARVDITCILVAQSPSERVDMMRAYKGALPPQAFEGIRQVALQALSADEFAKLEAALAA